ncbi:MAG: hypothetical protein DCF30_22005 [Hyphomicrobiales bacterium]|nr:MAG: hypothetical protein DCF30_22005 [Hyphomicrobiales bacterium]
MLEAITPAKQGRDRETGVFDHDGRNCMTSMSQSRRRPSRLSPWRTLAAATLLCFATAFPALAQDGRRVTVSGEISDTWCTISGLMFAKGTAHHQCAVWCALGGIPVSIRDAKGDLYLILKIGDDEDSVANPRIARMATHEVTVDGELLERDGVKYLLVDRIADDKGVITITHDEHGIQPFGN